MSRVEKDLFGNPLPPPAFVRKHGGRRKVGYAARPGTGPKGQRCATCKHAERVLHNGQTTTKCQLTAHAWTHGTETDINLRAPACRQWQSKPFKTAVSK